MLNKENPSYYSILTADVRYSTDINWFEKVLYSDITSLTNKNGYCTASNKYFAKIFGVSIRTISRAISNLTECKFIQCVLVRDDQNEIIERKIYLCHSVSIGIDKSVHTPIDNSFHTPIDKNGVYNNTSNINNINNNNKKNINTKKGIDLAIIGINDCDNVELEQAEYDKLLIDYDFDIVKQQIMQLDAYLEDHPKKYKSHYKTLRTWLLKQTKTQSAATYRGPKQNANHGPILSQRQINNLNAVQQAIAETSGMSHASDSE
jgi:hypothetical protein